MKHIKLILISALLACTSIGCARATLTGGFETSATQAEAAQGVVQARNVKDNPNLSKIDNDRSYNPHANDADNYRAGAHYGRGYGYGWGWNYYHRYGYGSRCFDYPCR